MTFASTASTLDLDDAFGFDTAEHRTPPVVRKPPSLDPATIKGQLQSSLELDARNDFASNDSAMRDKRTSNWLTRAQERIDGIVKECGRSQPTQPVVDSAKQLLSALFLTGLKPTRIVPTAHGGISVWFLRERYKLQFEISNEDATTAVISETCDECAPNLSEVSMKQSEILVTIKRVLPFLQQ